MNILSGGEGMTSEDARALWVDPDFAERVKRGIKGAMAQPSTKAKTLRHLEALHADPGWQERRAAGLAKAREAAAAPEVRARANASNKATHKALAQTPERRALFSRAARIGHRKRRTRKALAPFLHPPLSDTPGLTVWLAPPGSPLGITTP
ncbi:MAG: hypothetical protein KFF45_04520 [Thioalkalivibrio sp.]|nr:hypothetical protein [Thioalkalivibrio sp.]